MKILFVNPINRSYIVMPSLGLGYLAAQARKRGDAVTILNCLKEKMNFNDFKRFLGQNHFDVIGFQMYSYDLNPVKRHLEIVKSINHSTVLIAGGPHPSGTLQQTLKQLDQLDFAFRGEAEIGLPLLLDRLEDNFANPQNLTGVPGLIWRQEDAIRVNEPGYIDNLDTLDFPSWDLLEPHKYPEASHGAFAKNFPTAPIIISRGCPFQCTFCAGKAITGPGVRFRSIENVIEEMLYLFRDFGIREFLIEDENLTLHKKLTVEFCEKILSSPMKDISWSCPSGIRLDTLDRELLRLMERAGCYSLAMGIEFGTQKMLDQTRKKLTLETIEEKIDLLSRTNIKTTGFFMLGVPGENFDDINNTIKFALRLNIDRAQFNNYMPLPGSELGDRLRQQHALDNLDWDRLFVHNVAFTIPGITRKKLKHLQRLSYLKFYFRPKIMINVLKEIKSPRHLKYIIKRFIDSLS